MRTTPHSIRRQYLEVEVVGSERAALDVQCQLPGLCARVLAAAIERALDRCIPAGEYLRIDRLEVDAGTVAWPRLEQDLTAAVERALERAVQEQLPLAASGPAAAGADSGTVQPAVWHASYGHALDAALAYFLEYGSLPPAFHLPPAERFEANLLAAWREDAAPVTPRSTRLLAVLRQPAARERLCTQFSEEFLQTLLARMTKLGQQAIAHAFAVIRNEGSIRGEAGLLERQCWRAVFEGVAADPTLPFAQLERTVVAVVDAWKRARPRRPTSADRTRGGADASARVQGGVATEGARAGFARSGRRVPEAVFAAPTHPDAAEGIFVNDAGLVLLHPFLGRLFEGLGLADGERLPQPGRALHMLHFLCSGQEAAPEYELMLPKVLCNMPLTQPLAPGIVLLEAEKEEAQALLGAVIGHWEALRNTGPDGLRSAFLLRQGKLSERNGDWLLQVETDTADILLDQLPWGISAVKLPWMDRILWVEWR